MSNTAPNPPEMLLTMSDVEALVGRSKSWVYTAIKKGEFPNGAQMSRRCTRWRSSDVQCWIEKQWSRETTGQDAPAKQKILTVKSHGLGLREFFAGQALQGLLANPKLAQEILKHGGAHGSWIEDSAVAFSDRMLKALGEGPTA